MVSAYSQVSQASRRRTVVESRRFELERNALNPDVERMDDILFGVTEVLSRKPELGKQTQNPGIWAIAAAPWTEEPLTIYYSFDDNNVVLESVIATEGSE